MTEKLDLRRALAERVLVGDGALGTLLYQMGFPVGISYEELNLTRPDVIADVHRRYREAGASVIETNTFSANRLKLARFGLERRVADINRAGVRLARKAAGPDGYVAGSVGPIRTQGQRHASLRDLRSAYREQIEALLEEGVDAIMLETFEDVDELELAVETVRRLSDVPVVAQLALEDVDATPSGRPVADAIAALRDAGADVVGFNCRIGPSRMVRLLEAIPAPLRASVPFSVYPNAGFAEYVEGKFRYGTPPEYFSEIAVRFVERGARLIGGCCGTTPEHVAAIAQALQGVRPADDGAVRASGWRMEIRTAAGDGPEGGRGEKSDADTGSAAATAVPTLLDLVRTRHTVVVELDPPRDLDMSKFMEAAKTLRDAGVDALTMADNSLAMTRMSNLAAGFLVKERLGVRPLIHIACRDRNLIGTQSHLMGLHALGIDHVLAITGDPARFGDLPGASSVYDLTSVELIRMIKQLNEGISFSGKPLKHRARFVVGCAFNPNVKHLDKALERLEKKIEAGADFVMTQPVYDPALIETVGEAARRLPVPVFLGIMPVVSEANAVYLHNEVPGIRLPDAVLRRMAGLKGERGREEGIRIAKELLDVAIGLFHGIYLMTPMLFSSMTAELTRYVWRMTGRAAAGLPTCSSG
ncbi:MAG: bifunctional homocysteine S-methyltransferase/methylenetetrahydrofolate reductase [Candidatus Reconcilbacillus cellulovorans]|uniref:Bifunctional homocysteine S-methyltransferase/methylenetetrahydrofolate reductase n=1 Tax=Candidatus Reconcilbacillus cellulovorans TaxID=1906605 RepID=A0A2A6E3Y1_9BACL|nr:MAG: bifunctional homocysteine S-methyltransferase/methylenetetrahydrofolate reductase [Candidatus Reconcilbacillus cellulovorans]